MSKNQREPSYFALADAADSRREVEAILRDAVRSAASLVFAAQVVHHANPDPRRFGSKWDDIDFPSIQAVFNTRLHEEVLSAQADLFEDYPRWWKVLLNEWSARDQRDEYVRDLVERSPRRLGDMIGEYVREAFPFDQPQLATDALSVAFDLPSLIELAMQLGPRAAVTAQARSAVELLLDSAQVGPNPTWLDPDGIPWKRGFAIADNTTRIALPECPEHHLRVLFRPAVVGGGF